MASSNDASVRTRLDHLESSVSDLKTSVAVMRQEQGQLRESNGRIDGKLDQIAVSITALVSDESATPMGRSLVKQLQIQDGTIKDHAEKLQSMQRYIYLFLGGLGVVEFLIHNAGTLAKLFIH